MPIQHFCSGNHILVGLGGTGGKILRAFKMRMVEEFHKDGCAKIPVSLLYVDSSTEMMSQDGRARPDFKVMGEDASFQKNEFLNIKSVDVEYVLDHINNYPSVKGIVENAEIVKTAIGSLGEAAGQKRRAGRLLFAANAVGYVNTLQAAFSRCEAISGNGETLYVHIFAGLSGGTGSGSIIDVILQTRKAFPNANIGVYAMIPEMHLPKPNMDQGRYYQNGYAALNEINALQAGRWFPQDVTGHGKAKLQNDRVKGVANGLTLYSNVNENGLSVNSLNELPKIVSDFVFARIFFVNEGDTINEEIVRAYKYENMDDFAYEFDETAVTGGKGRIPARTKKINSFGIKRVMYPELRILKHITYSTAEKVLYQFKYNNWTENKGYINQERNKDYRTAYMNKEQLTQWMLDEAHLTLETKILPTDADFPRFNDYWHDKAISYAEEAKKADCPLNELDNIMGEFYTNHFREVGVEGFYATKDRAIPEMAKEVRHTIEKDLFEKWKQGDVSIVELLKVSKLLLERMEEIRNELVKKLDDEKANYEACDQDRQINVKEWSDLNVLKRMVGIGARRYADHQNILTDYYTSKTKVEALKFAQKLAAKVATALSEMNADISKFSQKVTDIIDETEKLITAQQKVNKGLEDMKGAIIEVSEEEAMREFEYVVTCDKIEMPNISKQIRTAILPTDEFTNFGNLSNQIELDEVKDVFDKELSRIVKAKHDELTDPDKKVLGLNILTQLRQKLQTDDEINSFATRIINQSGVFLKLNDDQLKIHLRNNEGLLSPTNHASINKKTIFVSIPSPDADEGLKKFADKLEKAFLNSITTGNAIITVTVNRNSPRKNELSIMSVGYCYPMRAIDWLSTYRSRYEDFLNTGNPDTDVTNAILLHSEGDGSDLPSLFAVENAEEIAQAKIEAMKQATAAPQTAAAPQAAAMPPQGPAMPPMPPAAGSPVPPPPPVVDVKVHLYINGQQYGPYNLELCKQMVKTKQLTSKTLVWMEGMAGWTPAAEVVELQSLFAPPAPAPGMPPMPPMPPQDPPMPPMPPTE